MDGGFLFYGCFSQREKKSSGKNNQVKIPDDFHRPAQPGNN